MTDPAMTGPAKNGPAAAFRAVDPFLDTLVHVRVLKTAFELGAIDRLIDHGAGSAAALGRLLGLDPAATDLLFGLLAEAGVVALRQGDVRLTAPFQHALRHRDLLEIRLDYAGFTLDDFTNRFTGLLRDAGAFMAESQLFGLFDYGRALRGPEADPAHTRTWMRVTSTLARYEAAACLAAYDIAHHRRMLDVGGNSGAFALRLCAANPALRATVFDLPVVCDIGLEHVLPHAEASRIAFLPGDLRAGPLPPGHDLITFKSMLHDWPEETARAFIGKAATALRPGGTLLLFERAPLRIDRPATAVSMIPNLLFFRSYRPASLYTDHLAALGFTAIRHAEVELDSPFTLITARKPPA